MKTIKKLSVLMSAKSRLKYKTENSQNIGFILGETTEKRDNYSFLNIFARAIIVCAIMLGSIEGFMSAFNIPYNKLLVFSVLIVFNFFLMLLQLSFPTRIGGYFLVLWGLIEYYGQNINVMRSGINAITNLSYELIRIKFNLPEVSGFDEIVTNRGITIPTLLIVTGCCYNILLWEICGRSMNIIVTAIFSFSVISAGIFFDGVPSIISIILLSIGWMLIACVKFNGKYFYSFRKKHQYKVYQWGDKQYYFKLLNGKALSQLIVLLLSFVITFGGLLCCVITPDFYNRNVPESEFKEHSDFVVRDIMILAFSRYKGLSVKDRVSNGSLGHYSSVKPDYRPDLEITYLPTTFERQYLKTFVGTSYSSYGWKTDNVATTFNSTNKTAQTAKDNNVPFHKMRVRNIDLTTSTPFLPYVTDLNSNDELQYINDANVLMHFPRGSEYEITYYYQPDITVTDEWYNNYVRKKYLQVPEANKELIEQLCIDKGFSADDPELADKIANFFETEYTYTLNPGLVPWKTDFVNYFLFENKEGLCAHFASAGTLIYRCLGIPARYVEGYVIDYPLLKEEEKVLDESPEQWYGGTPTPIALQPVSVTLNDYFAHGWVEIYKEGYGWVPVELTPGAGELVEEEEEETSMTDLLISFFMTTPQQIQERQQMIEEYAQKTTNLGIYALVLIIIAAISVLIFKIASILLRHIIRLHKFSRKNAGSVIEIYNYLIQIFVLINKIKPNSSHKEIGNVLDEYMHSSDVVIETIEKLLYSPQKPDNEECLNVFMVLFGVLNKALNENGFLTKIKILIKL